MPRPQIEAGVSGFAGSYRIAAVSGGVVILVAAAIGIYGSLSGPKTVPGGLPFVQGKKPKQVSDLRFQDEAGRARSLAEFRGKLVLLNIWATWCAPCREEMPALDRLQAKLGGRNFEVVALSIDQQGPGAVRKFFDDVGIKALQLYIDPSAQAALTLGAVGVASTLLIDRTGQQIGRHVGPANRDAPGIVEDFRRRINAGPQR